MFCQLLTSRCLYPAYLLLLINSLNVLPVGSAPDQTKSDHVVRSTDEPVTKYKIEMCTIQMMFLSMQSVVILDNTAEPR